MNESAVPDPEQRPFDTNSRPSVDGRQEVDVRQQLAADRTLLAWTRTAISLAGLGFVVARFTLFLYELRGLSTKTPEAARGVGLALVGAGMVTVAIGLLQYRQVVSVLGRHGDRPGTSTWPALVGATVTLFAIIAVGVYLAARVH